MNAQLEERLRAVYARGYLELTDEAASRTVWVSWSSSRRLLASAELFAEHVVERARAGRLPAPVVAG